MNRIDFQELAELRLKEANALLAAGFPDGAYYLAGYAVECALKACIAKRTQLHDFPEKKLVNDSHTHNLKELMRLAELKTELDTVLDADPEMRPNLETVQDWAETARYQRKTVPDTIALLTAIENQKGGLLPWIRQRW
jgi:HEPN domain-containing protein